MKTVKVRIAVAVDPSGAWCSYGDSIVHEDAAMDEAQAGVDAGENRYWLTAELTIPEPTTVEASVSSGGEGE